MVSRRSRSHDRRSPRRSRSPRRDPSPRRADPPRAAPPAPAGGGGGGGGKFHDGVAIYVVPVPEPVTEDDLCKLRRVLRALCIIQSAWQALLY